ncbi:type III-B CRISPR module-associated Cmr3 family protein [Vreelandella aquamarina]
MSQWKQYLLKVTLEQDVILGATGASLGNLDTLDYLPGSVFLGAAASRLYSELTDGEAWRLFHSGAVRFNDALPLAGNEPAWPVPLSWHHYKGETFKKDTQSDAVATLIASQIFDSALNKDTNDQRQPKQLRKGYVTLSGGYVTSSKQLRMKTALDADTGRAAQGQLFGYQSLEAGQVFVLMLEAAQADLALLDKAVASLTGTLRLGRSRSAQYGRVRVEPWESEASQLTPPAATDTDRRNLSLLLLSDLALVDENGQPTVQPHPEYLRLPEGAEWLVEKSFLRTRRYSPYNAYRRSHDEERQVIARGSVLRYQLREPLTEAQCASLQQGMGMYQSTGLGKVALNPSWLNQAKPCFNDAKPLAASPEEVSATQSATPATSRLLKAVQQRAQGSDVDHVAEAAQRLFAILVAAVDEARVWQGIAAHQPVPAPNRSQWGRVKTLANQYRQDPKALRQAFYQDKQAIIRERSGWDLEIGPGEILAQRIIPELEALKDSDIVAIVGRLSTLGLTQHWEIALQGSRESASASSQLAAESGGVA